MVLDILSRYAARVPARWPQHSLRCAGGAERIRTPSDFTTAGPTLPAPRSQSLRSPVEERAWVADLLAARRGEPELRSPGSARLAANPLGLAGTQASAGDRDAPFTCVARDLLCDSS